MVYETGLSHQIRKGMGFKTPDVIKFFELGPTELTSASGHCPCVRTVYASMNVNKLKFTKLRSNTNTNTSTKV